MGAPSIKTLSQCFPENAEEARAIMIATRSQLLAHPGAVAILRACFHAPHIERIRMEVLNTIGGFHGVECVESYNCEFAEYLNAGDTYNPTLIYWRGNYRVQSLGDFIEIMERQSVRFK